MVGALISPTLSCRTKEHFYIKEITLLSGFNQKRKKYTLVNLFFEKVLLQYTGKAEQLLAKGLANKKQSQPKCIFLYF